MGRVEVKDEESPEGKSKDKPIRETQIGESPAEQPQETGDKKTGELRPKLEYGDFDVNITATHDIN